MYKISFYVPEADAENVKQAMFDAGAGRFGQYDHCAWQTLGNGQFRPLPGSTPHLGEHNRIHREPEYQVEMVCQDDLLEGVIRALYKAHPYEQPAYAVWKIWQLDHVHD